MERTGSSQTPPAGEDVLSGGSIMVQREYTLLKTLAGHALHLPDFMTDPCTLPLEERV